MNDDAVRAQLESFRASIDNLDAALLHILAERFNVTRKVGAFKSEVGLPSADRARELRQIERLRALGAEAGLNPDFAEALMELIFAEVVANHDAIRDAN